MQVRRVGFDESANAVKYLARRNGREYNLLMRPVGEGAWSMTVLDKRSGRVIYEGEAPDFGDRGESHVDLIGSLWWAERMIDERAPQKS